MAGISGRLPRAGARSANIKSRTSQEARSQSGMIFWLTCTAVVLMFTLNSQLLDLYVNYTITGGSLLGKFHPATYVCIVLLGFVVMDGLGSKRPLDRYLLNFFFLFLAMTLFVAFKGKGGSAAAIVDCRVAPIVLVLALSRLNKEQVRTIAGVYVVIAAANGFFCLLDFVRGSYLFPAFQILDHEDFFRPIGFTGHPTQAAAMSMLGLFFALTGAVKGVWQRPLMLFFLLCLAVCKERVPMALAGLIILVNAFRPFTPRTNRWERIVDLGIVFLIPVVIAIAFASGAFDRFLALGLWDNSSQSRFKIYDTLYYLTPQQLMSGIDNDMATYVAQQAVNSGFIESSFLIATFAGGLPFGIAYMVANIAYFWRFIKKNYLFGIATLIVAIAGNDLMTKGMTVPGLTILGYYLWRMRKPAPLRNARVTNERYRLHPVLSR